MTTTQTPLSELTSALRDELGFGEPFANNGAWMFPAPQLTAGSLQERIIDATAPLNDADEALAAWVASKLDRASAEDRPALQQAIDGWRLALRSEQNLLGVPFAGRALNLLAKTMPLPRTLDDELPELRASLAALPSSTLAALRIDVSIRSEHLVAAVFELAAAATAPPFAQLIDRVELCSIHDGDEVLIRCSIDADQSGRADDLERLTSVMACRLPPAACGRPWRRRGTLSIAEHAGLSQGFALVKRLLKPVDLLDELYDPALEHGPLRATPNDQTRWVRGRFLAAQQPPSDRSL